MSKSEIFSIILNSFKNFKKQLSLHEPSIDTSDIKTVKNILSKKLVSTSAEKIINKFEKKISKLTKSKYVVATNTGTSALHIALKAIKLKKNEEILIPDINYIAAANSVIHCGGIPHFVDIDISNLGIDVKKLDTYLKKITIVKKNKLINKKSKNVIKAIIPTHVFGNACDIINLKKISYKYKLFLIEDASESVGSFFKNKHLGTFGDIGVLSFNGNKIITTGGGGAILTSNLNLFNRCLHLSKISRVQKKYWEFNYDEPGFNFRMPALNAALGISQISKLKNILNNKKKIYLEYKKYFRNIKSIKLLEPTNKKSNYWLNAIQIEKSNTKLIEEIILKLQKKKISVRPVWKQMHKINYLSKYPKMNLSNANYIKDKLLSLPSGVNIFK